MGDDRVYYAIGDVHGELDRLVALHDTIDRHHDIFFSGRARMLVHLGDYVDRGPDSAGVVDRLMELDRRDDVVCLKGNHEAMMVDAVRHARKREWWSDHGGAETLASYRDREQYSPSDTHLDWMDALPTRHHVPDRKLVFVHAAIDPDHFPEPDPHLHLWGRTQAFFDSEHWMNPALDGYRVVHGHTPTNDNVPDISRDGRRFNIDTGAVYGGLLTAAVLAPNSEPKFLFA